MGWLLMIGCFTVAYFILKSNDKELEQEKKDGVIISDKLADYLGGFPSVSGKKVLI